MTRIILASGSAHRQALLRNAGIAFEAIASDFDERALEAPLARSGANGEDIAQVLAEAKASDVSQRHADALVIGADQTLTLGSERLHKPAGMEEARRQLLALSGRTHRLASAVVLAHNGAPLWRHVETADITFRALTPPQIGRYLARAGADALTSVGCYQIEGPGLQLMERVEGDFFTIVGLPMLPLIRELRAQGALDD
ncbi:Maf-like protein [Aureimonas populi]|uniref:Nucleoside triphosphate pyrophosphatase n=1 Tax=Aureimonas populi TaxID=1701758 RepID=A0ABW5CRE9_9HYPH|nr:Maf-like protein [Aureimonas populi]